MRHKIENGGRMSGKSIAMWNKAIGESKEMNDMEDLANDIVRVLRFKPDFKPLMEGERGL